MRTLPLKVCDFSILAPPMNIPWICLATFLVASAAQASPQAPAFRLGDVATPLDYNATLAIDPRQPQFSGEIKIALRVNRAAPVLWLNATDLTIDKSTFADPAAAGAQFTYFIEVENAVVWPPLSQRPAVKYVSFSLQPGEK